MEFLTPTQEQMKAVAELQDEGPIYMLNLLKFKPDGGEESYETYTQKVKELMFPKGMEFTFTGKAMMSVIGEEDWDEVLIVKYPSKDAFIEMSMDPEYLEIFKHRTEAVLDSRLILTKQV